MVFLKVLKRSYERQGNCMFSCSRRLCGKRLGDVNAKRFHPTLLVFFFSVSTLFGFSGHSFPMSDCNRAFGMNRVPNESCKYP